MSNRISAYHALLLTLHVGGIAALWMASAQWLLLTFLSFLVLQVLGANIALHRFFAHESFSVGKPAALFLLFMGNLTALGSSLSWILTHRHHHRFADSEYDCHSPSHMSAWRILLGYWRPPDEARSTLSRLPLLPLHLFVHRRYFLLHFAIMGALCLIDLKLFMFGYALPNLMVYYSLYSVVFFCHSKGYRNFATADNSRNCWWVALFTFGEGWHNNHHHCPGDFSTRVHWWEIDLSGWIIRWVFARGSANIERFQMKASKA